VRQLLVVARSNWGKRNEVFGGRRSTRGEEGGSRGFLNGTAGEPSLKQKKGDSVMERGGESRRKERRAVGKVNEEKRTRGGKRVKPLTGGRGNTRGKSAISLTGKE